jgi:hypothetical protein
VGSANVSFNGGLAAAELIGLISTTIKGTLIAGYYTHTRTDGSGEMM